MRVLTAMGVCDEVGVHSYKANYVTQTLAQEAFSNGVKIRFVFVTCRKLLLMVFDQI